MKEQHNAFYWAEYMLASCMLPNKVYLSVMFILLLIFTLNHQPFPPGAAEGG